MPPDFDVGIGRPFGVGLGVTVPINDNFTLVFRGEIYLDAATTFSLQSDGPSLVQIDTAGDGTYSHQVRDQIDALPDGTVTVGPLAPGWYPIRAALTPFRRSVQSLRRRRRNVSRRG